MSARRWRGTDAYGGVVFALAERTPPSERASALPRHLACALFDAWWPEHRARGGVTTALTELSVALGGTLSEDTASLRRRAWTALRDGRALALRDTRADVRAPAGAPETHATELAPSATRPDAVKTWVTIRLVDDDTPPRPVAGARYRIRLPDGSLREGQLDEHGTAHYGGIDAGVCEVSFPDYDARDWRHA